MAAGATISMAVATRTWRSKNPSARTTAVITQQSSASITTARSGTSQFVAQLAAGAGDRFPAERADRAAARVFLPAGGFQNLRESRAIKAYGSDKQCFRTDLDFAIFRNFVACFSV
jgi:hypothetical protein